jgi:hypothetical protein
MKIFKKEKNIEFLVALLFLLAGAGLRLIPHAPNFTPVAAMALFGAVYFSKKTALILPLAIMAISDVFVGFYDFRIMAFVYGSFALCTIIGFWLKNHKKWYNILGSSVLASVVFFIATNFAVWAFSPWYPKSFAGMVQCYVMALPFFKNTLLGDAFFVSVFFGAYELLRVQISEKFKLREAKNYQPY